MKKVDWIEGRESALQKFFRAVPFIGYNHKLVYQSWRILKRRAFFEFEESWREAGFTLPDIVPITEAVFHATCQFLKWPNSYYFPNDRFSVITGQIPGVHFDPEDIFDELGEIYPGCKTENVLMMYEMIEKNAYMLEFAEWARMKNEMEPS